MKELTAKQIKRIETAPISARGILKRAYQGNSRKTAIKAMCLECLGFDRAGVADCTAPACPLFKFRPFQHIATEAKKTV